MTQQQADYLIAGGLTVTGDGIARQDILVSGETISAIGPDLPSSAAGRVIDATGKYVLGGQVRAAGDRGPAQPSG